MEKNKKLLYITNGINGSGGLERVLAVKASALADQYNYDITILGLNNGNEDLFYEFSDKIKFKSINVYGNFIQYVWRYRSGIQRVVDSLRPDIILVCDDGFKGFWLPVIIKTNAKLVYERHVSKLIELSTDSIGKYEKIWLNFKWWMMERLGNKFDKFVILTEKTKQEWSSLNNLISIANPLPFILDQSSHLDNKVVICVGKISFQKGQDLLIKAWEIVHKKHPEWRLELYGKRNNSFIDIDKYAYMNIHYNLPEKNIRQRYLESSIYVMSSRFEGFAMVLIEAMSLGLPCISFDCKFGPSEIIIENHNGYLVELRNTELLAQRICVLMENDAERKRLGMNAKNSIERFSLDLIVEKWDLLFKELYLNENYN